MHQITLRVPYADTDQMGVVYYANYLVYFERARTEWLRTLGITYKQLESDECYLPVSECSIKYLLSAKYDDLLTICTTLTKIGAASIIISYEIFCDDKKIAIGLTTHPFVNSVFKPVKIPQKIRQILMDNKVENNERKSS